MDSADIQETIYGVIANLFGTMFFSVIEPLEAVPDQKDWHLDSFYIEARIGFKSQVDGEVCFYFPMQLARHITMSFLGMSAEEVADRQILDTMGETANITIGSLLGVLDPSTSCTLGIPKVRRLDGFSPEAILDAPDLCVYETDFGLLWMRYGSIASCDTRACAHDSR